MGMRFLLCFALLLAACSNKSSKFETDAATEDATIPDDGGVIGTDDAEAGFDETCQTAAATKSYVGCDYWPTVVANNVWSIFDFAVVVANGGTKTANITITGNGVNQMGSIEPGNLETFYLPWVAALKGQDCDSCGVATALTGSVVAKKGAYHLVSSVPVSVYQFNALEYKGTGGPKGKNWSSCPGNTTCPTQGQPIGCYSFSNDASLLLPSTAMTGTYRIMSQTGWSYQGFPVMGPYFTITATRDATNVTVKTSGTSRILPGGNIPMMNGAGMFNFTMQAGDVVEIAGEKGNMTDFSGTLVTSNNPIQVITGLPCVDQPEMAPACDHIEESVFPAETLGKHYFVTVPTAPTGNPVGHIVRVFGNVNGTNLTYTPMRPTNCPGTINAGQVVDCGVVNQDFEIKGDKEFAVGSYSLGGTIVDPNGGRGDPDQSFAVAVEQYRTAYVFLAPADYDQSFVDIVGPTGVNVTVDNTPAGTFTPIGMSGYGVARVSLSAIGVHKLKSDKPVGIQVMGYGTYTSYQYPGGANLSAIAPAPVN
jgi:hypothetical protein